MEACLEPSQLPRQRRSDESRRTQATGYHIGNFLKGMKIFSASSLNVPTRIHRTTQCSVASWDPYRVYKERGSYVPSTSRDVESSVRDSSPSPCRQILVGKSPKGEVAKNIQVSYS